MKKLLAFAFFLLPSVAQAQNVTCPTRPPGDSTNACASTAFVQNAVAGGGGGGGFWQASGANIFNTNAGNVGIGTGAAVINSKLGVMTPNSTFVGEPDVSATRGAVATFYDGSNASPATVALLPTVYIGRTESIATGGGDGSQNPALYVINKSTNVEQSVALSAASYLNAPGNSDNVAVYAQAQSFATGQHGAFAFFGLASASSPTASALGAEVSTVNQTGNNHTYSPTTLFTNPATVGYDMTCSGNGSGHSCSVGLVVRGPQSIPVAGEFWDVGVAFLPGSTGQADIRTDSTGAAIITAPSGARTKGINLAAGATFSGNAFDSPGFAVTGTGAVSAPSVTSPSFIGGTGTTGTQMAFKTTTGAGTTDQFVWVGGNNGGTAFATLASTGFNNVAIGATTAGTGRFTTVNATTVASAYQMNGTLFANSSGGFTNIFAPNGTTGVFSGSPAGVFLNGDTITFRASDNSTTRGAWTSSNFAILTPINNVIITQPASLSTLTIAAGKTLTVNNTIGLTGTDGTTMTFNSTSGQVPTITSGTFTPNLAMGGACVGCVYVVQIGRYQKIDFGALHLVLFHIVIAMSSKGTSTGAVTIQGLPFTSINIANNFQSVATNVSGVSGTLNGQWQGAVPANSTNINPQYLNTGNATSPQDTDITNGATFILQGSYESQT